MIERAGQALLKQFNPETAHRLAMRGLRAGLAPTLRNAPAPEIAVNALGMQFAHPLGLAAGFDKHAEAVGPLLRAGFAFVEIGAVTPLPQPGNPKPRHFRLDADRAAINRYGFNSVGMEVVRKTSALDAAQRSDCRREPRANKTSADRAGDYGAVLNALYDHADFFTVNVSSPNTEGLRDLQAREALDSLLGRVMAARDAKAEVKPILLKISPDLTEPQIDDVAELALAHALDGVIATNTTLSRDGLRSPHASEAGGLSGAPVFDRSTEVLRRLHILTDRKVTLIGVGGIEDADTAYAKIRAGATLLQTYTGFAYRGTALIRDVIEGLDSRRRQDGFGSIMDAIGADI